MQTLLAYQVASISELKKNPSRLIQEADGQAIAILNHNTAAAYLVPTKTFERLIELADDNELRSIVAQRLSDHHSSIKVDIDDL